MSKGFRLFYAPDCDSEKLPIPPSPWHFERLTKIPLGQWEIIIEFAKTVNHEKAEMLESKSVGSYQNDGLLNISTEDSLVLISFMKELQEKLNNVDPIYIFRDRTFNEALDEFENDEYQRMLEAVIAVYEESIRLGEPLCAYSE